MGMLDGIDKTIWPCENLCQNQSELCGGCGRDEYERFAWGLFTDEERKQRVLTIKRHYYGNIIYLLNHSVLCVVFGCSDNTSHTT